MVRPRSGLAVAPRLTLNDFSGSSGCEPSASATGLFTARVEMSTGRPAMKLVEVVVKNCWWSDGARKPFDTEPRSAKPSTGSQRAANLPFQVEPKSEKCS